MKDILIAQNFLLNANQALMPLAALFYSALHSWHCAVMCGPLVVTSKSQQLHQLLLFRLFSYTAMGAFMGYAGQTLKNLLEFELLKVFAFIVFIFITLFFVLPKIFPMLNRFAVFRPRSTSSIQAGSHSLRGVLLAIVPCHLLIFFYGIAALSTSAVFGGALLFGHAVMTTPALSYSSRWATRIASGPTFFRPAIRILLLALLLFNLFYFAGHLFHAPADVKSHLLFCW